MPLLSYQPALTGPTLEAAVDATADTRPALIEGLLYERSVLLVSADGGTGKSTLVANIIAQASLGLPVFQAFHVPRPLRCYYIPFERGSEEIRERLKYIKKAIPFSSSHIYLFNHTSFLPNLYEKADQDFLLASIHQDCPTPPDVVFYDPIYQAVAGGLCNEDRVSLFIRFNVRLMQEFGCATWLNHHTGKQSYAQDGSKIEKDDPYYGSSFLRNHCTGSYYVKENEDHTGTTWLEKKDNLKALIRKFTLTFEPETYTSYLKDDLRGLSAEDRLKVVLRQFKRDTKTFTFKQAEGCLMGVSTSRLRSLFSTPPFSEVLKKQKSLGSNTLYTVEGDI